MATAMTAPSLALTLAVAHAHVHLQHGKQHLTWECVHPVPGTLFSRWRGWHQQAKVAALAGDGAGAKAAAMVAAVSRLSRQARLFAAC